MRNLTDEILKGASEQPAESKADSGVYPQNANSPKLGENRIVLDGDFGIDLEAQKNRSRSKFMAEFFVKIETVQHTIEAIRISTFKIYELGDKASTAVGRPNEQLCSQELEQTIQDTNKRCNAVKKILKEIKAETDELIENKKVKQGELRIRRNLHVTHTQRFVEVLKDYQKSQQSYKLKVKEKITRQVKTVKPDVSEKEVDEIIQKGGDTSVIFQQAILNSQVDPVSSAYLEATDKYQDVLRLEKSIVELHQMFIDMAVLVEQQGEMLDKIEYSVNAAEEYVEQGNKELIKANKARRSLRKKYIIIAVIMVLIGVIALTQILRLVK